MSSQFTVWETEKAAKRAAEMLKHINTLSTGSLVLMATFLERVFPQPHARPLVILAFVAFAFSITCAVMALSVQLNIIDEEARVGLNMGCLTTAFYSALPPFALIAFIAGIWLLAGFTISNLVVLPTEMLDRLPFLR